MTALVKDEIEQETSWDLRRLLIAFFLFLFIVVGGYWAKVHVLDKKAGRGGGSVAGSVSSKEEVLRLPSQQEVEKRVETIKKEIQELKPEDITRQVPVKKILQDLENLQSSATSQVVGGTKNAICEEVKKTLGCQ